VSNQAELNLFDQGTVDVTVPRELTVIVSFVKFRCMSTADLIYKKIKLLPSNLQSEALDFVEYLDRRHSAPSEASEWKHLSEETQRLPSIQNITEDDISSEIAEYRANQ